MKVLKWLGIELVEVSVAEKLVSAVGSALAIFCVFCITRYSLPAAAAAGVIASMGATAVLLYAVPHGPLSQPWPLIGGHTISAFIGVCCAHGIANPALATAIAVGLAIGVMYQFKCIHPPGGATAFTAVMGGQAVHELGFHFVLYPVLLNAVTMLLLAIALLVGCWSGPLVSLLEPPIVPWICKGLAAALSAMDSSVTLEPPSSKLDW
jgi:CBS-domain-containing membrane protein